MTSLGGSLFDAPPLAEVGSTEDCHLHTRARYVSFMIFLRMAWNLLASFTNGFVKKSAMLSSVRTNGTSISRSSTMSRTKKCRRCTCFIRSWCSGL